MEMMRNIRDQSRNLEIPVLEFAPVAELIMDDKGQVAGGVAFNLETYRSAAYVAVERTILVGHWHVLATLSAVIVLLLIVDRLGTKGWVRQAVGWGLLVGSTLSFLFVNVYMFRQPGQEKAWTMPIFETGIALSLLALALFVAVHLVDHVRQQI